jgi:molybdopterin molybdotransferase
VIGFDEALGLVLELALPLGVEKVPLDEAHGRLLSDAVRARIDAPGADVSAMDGYAVREADLETAPARLRVIGESFPGRGFIGGIGPGQAVRIFTGAPLPEGAERVVIQELARRDGDEVVIPEPPRGRTHIRARGSDFRAGDWLLDAGRRMDPAALVVAAGGDVAEVEVFRKPRVAVLGTGDELVEPGTARSTPGAVPESVTFGVAGMARAWGGEVVSRRRLPDDMAMLEHAARQALKQAEVVVVTGGASVGEKDFARAMFAEAEPEPVFSKVAIKPGKPAWVSRARDGRIIVGLPGNPTSALVTARLFLAPLLAGLSGDDPMLAHAWRELPLAEPLPETGDRETFLRAALGAEGLIPLASQDSGAQKPLASTDVLIRRAAGAPAAAAGEWVHALGF